MVDPITALMFAFWGLVALVVQVLLVDKLREKKE